MRSPLLVAVALSAAACAADQESVDSGSGDAIVLCDPAACGPQLGMPNFACPDGSTGGPTGRCIEHAGGQCGWEIRECCVVLPADGACVAPVFCGGIAALPCPDGRACADDPRDDCAPPNGADCGGLCAP